MRHQIWSCHPYVVQLQAAINGGGNHCKTNLSLIFLKLGEGNNQVLIENLISEELNGSLVNPPGTLYVVVFLLKSSIPEHSHITKHTHLREL